MFLGRVADGKCETTSDGTAVLNRRLMEAGYPPHNFSAATHGAVVLRSLVRTFIWLVFLAGLAGGGYWAWQHHRAETRTVEKSADERVPVTVETAATKNFPVYLDSLGRCKPGIR